jgi:hypothetical protein
MCIFVTEIDFWKKFSVKTGMRKLEIGLKRGNTAKDRID